MAADLPETKRIGVTTSRGISKAVARNYAKRRLRAWIELYFEQIEPGWELVFIARPPLVTAPFEDIGKAIGNVLQRAGLLQTENNNSRGSDF